MDYLSNYKTFNIEGPPSLGVLTYLYSQRKYIKSDFISRLNEKYKINNIDELIKRNLIISIPNDYKGAFNIPPRLFSANTTGLKVIPLEDESLTKTIDSGLHLLNGMKFNHWNHNYKNIELNIPEEYLIKPDIYSTSFSQDKYLEHFNKNIKPFWGGHKREYFINQVCKDDKYSGRHHNFFVYNKKELRKFIFPEPVEIDIAFCHPILLADLLLKGFGKNDFSNTMMTFYNPKKTNNPYNIYEVIGKDTSTSKDYEDIYNSMDIAPSNDIYELIGREREEGKQLFNSTINDISRPSLFKDGFPDAYRILHNIKMGERGYFAHWAEDEFKTTDKRLTMDRKSTEDIRKFNRAKAVGQLHYKAISLKLQLKEVQIMRQVWSELKREGILFVPIHDSVIVDRENYKKSEKILKGVWKENIDKKFKVIVKAENLLTNQLIHKQYEHINNKKI